jgi:transcriptional regulator with XRE-family HTH domain
MLRVWRDAGRVTRMALPEDRRHMVGERLAKLREQKALTLHDLEKLSGVGADGISKIENGHRKPRPATLRKLARALEVEVEDFFRESAVPLTEAPRKAGQSLLERAQDAARQDEKKDAQAVNRLFASEGVLPWTNIAEFEEDRFRAELRARGFPDEYFEGFIWPLVTTVNQQEREISRLREENSQLREEAEHESVHR